MARPYLTKENELKVNEENLDYLIESPWKAVIESFCETPTNYHRELTTELVLSEAIEKPIERQTRYDQMQVATILKNLGYEKSVEEVGVVANGSTFETRSVS